MYYLAIRMLFGDHAKYIMLISALTFASLLMTQQSSVFCGLMRWTTAALRNSNASIWVVDPKVEQVNEIKPMRDTDLSRVRSIEGVEFAVPLYMTIQQARLPNGYFKSVQLIGLDSSTLIGFPPVMIEGKLEDLWQANAVILDAVGIERLAIAGGPPLRVGDVFEINDHEARIVGICDAERSFFGYPYVFTTYERAIEMAPKTRKNLGYVLVEPAPGWTKEVLARKIEKETGLKAYTDDEFFWSTIWWFFRNTGIPMSFGTTIVLGFMIGLGVAGQTFYSFVLENLRHLGALKAMGASNMLLCRMLVLQAFTVGFIGYGLGVGLTALFGYAALTSKVIPFFMPYQILFVSMAGIIIICIFSAILGILRISKYEPAEVFRA